MLIVDVEGDWGGKNTRALREVLPDLLRCFECYSVTATFFVVADLVSSVSDLLPVDGPHEIGSHGLTHTPLTRLARPDVVFEIVESKRVLEKFGYRVTGFRAPFLDSPPGLAEILVDAGYEYDASCGSVYPSLSRSGQGNPYWNTSPKIIRVGSSTLSTGLIPFNLTYLRIFHPVGLRWVPSMPRVFSFHLHELLSGSDGWQQIPAILRGVHMRNSGPGAWTILETLLKRFGSRFVSCRAYLEKETSG